MQGPIPNPVQLLLFNPQVVPTRHTVARLRLDGKEYVLLKFDDPTGAKTVLYDLEAAKGLADSIRAAVLGLTLETGNTINGKDGNK